jgi:hypothetical protein
MRRLSIAAVSCALLASMCVAASASATYYASPAGGAAAINCQSPGGPYCTITEALTNSTPGAEVVLTPGNYMTGSTTVAIANRTLHGQAAQPSATITSTAALAVDVQAFGQLSDIRIDDSAGTALRQYGTTSVSDRLFAHTTGGAFACDLIAGTLRDSVCWNTNPADFSAGLGTTTGGSPTTVRNVTAVATGTPNSFGIFFWGGSGTTTVDAKSVIADGFSVDVRALNGGTATTITLDHSDYASELAVGSGATVTPHGSGTNLTGAPLFANASTGDFHQLTGSPTIGTGAMDGSSGTTDLDGLAWGAAYDIGAYKFVPPPPPGGGGSTSPTGGAPTTPSAKKCKKRKHRAAASKKCKKRRK